jgi:hypothetical protein
MGKKREFDGEEIGRKLLDPRFKIELPSQYSALLEHIRNNKNFRKAWKTLWKWRYIGDKQTRIMFFKVQASLRNPEVQAKRAEFTTVEDLIEFYEYAEKHYHIHVITAFSMTLRREMRFSVRTRNALEVGMKPSNMIYLSSRVIDVLKSL